MPKKNDGLAHFQVCTCGRHGRIVFPDGRTGGEIASKEESIRVLQYAMLVDKFQDVNIFPDRKLAHIQREIAESSIAEEENQVSGYFRKELNTWNAGKLHQTDINPRDFHKVVDELWHYDDGD